jgi:hypothetical protein
LTIPTRENQIRIEYTTESFDPYASTLKPDSLVLHHATFFAWVRALDGQEKAAIKLGTGNQQAHAHGQAIMASLGGNKDVEEGRVTTRAYLAVMLVKSPKVGKKYTTSDGRDGKSRKITLGWKDAQGVSANPAFWDVVNQILDLDTQSPVDRANCRL